MSLRNFAACVQLSALAVGVRLVRKPPFSALRANASSGAVWFWVELATVRH